jgi:predicted Zn-dependent peptidase
MFRKSVFVLVVWFLGAVNILQSQNRISSYSNSSNDKWDVRVYNNDPMKTKHYTFKNNGLTLITSENKRSPRIYTMVAVKTGSKNDPADHTGLAHYLEHLLFKGTDKYGTQDFSKEKPYLDQIETLYETYNHSTDEAARKMIYRQIDSVSQLAAKHSIANEFDKMCQAMGAQGTNAFTSNDMTVYINDIPSNAVDQWLDLESERYRNPVFRLFHTELEAVYEEKNISIDRDMSQVWEQMFAELFKNHNYGKQTTIGTIEHLKNPSLKAIREYYETYYVPNNMAIILSGDFDSDEVANKVYEHFAYMKRKEVPQYQFEDEEPRNVERKIEVTGPSEEMVMMGYKLPKAGNKDLLTAKLIDLILSNSNAGLIDLDLNQKQLVLEAGSSIEEMKDHSFFYMYGQPKAGQSLDTVKSLLLQEIEKLKRGEFDASLVKDIILNKEISELNAYKDNATRCMFLMDNFIKEIDHQKAINELWEMSQISKDEIIRVANEYFGNDRVAVYKNKGETPENVKIVKPEINPVELNRDKQSEFLANWLNQKPKDIDPVFFDGKIDTKMVKNTPIYTVKNTENRLFNLSIRINYGQYHNLTSGMLGSYFSLIGNGKLTAEQISKKFYHWGCNYSVTVGTEHSYISLSGPQENMDSAWMLLSSLVNSPEKNKEVLNELVSDILQGRENSKSNPQAISQALSSYMKYGPVNPRTHILSNSQLKSLTVEELQKVRKVWLSASRQVSYFGPSDATQVEKLLSTTSWIGKNYAVILETVSQKFKLQDVTNPVVYFTDYPQVQSSIYWYTKIGNYDRQISPLVNAYNQYFGGDMSSVVFQTIRESKALAYSTFASVGVPSKPDGQFSFTAFIGTQSDKFHDAIAGMNELIGELPKNEQVFEMSKNSLLNSLRTNRVMPEERVQYLYYMQQMKFEEDPAVRSFGIIQKLKFEDIANYHKQNISGKPYALSIVASKDRIKDEDLSKYGKVIKLTTKDIFGY